MKKILLKFCAVIVPIFMMTGCLFEEEDLFDKPASLRMDEEIKADMALLIGASKGWLVDYYPEKNYSMGGYVMHWKFNEDGSVDVACEAGVNGIPAGQSVTSLWAVKPGHGPILSFDTYNEVLHYFCQPSQSDIDGLAGDYEFVIRRNIKMENNLVITGKKNGNKLILRPVAENDDPAQYLAKVKEFSDAAVANRNFDVQLNGTSVGTTVFSTTKVAGLTVRSINMEITVPSGNEDEETTKDTTVTFTYTPNGFRFNEPISFQGLTMQNFVWDEAERKYTCSDPGVSIEWICTDPPPQFNYNAFIGDFTLTYGGTGLAGPTTTYSTLNVTITADVPGESYILKGLLKPENDAQYTVRLRYDPAKGLIFDAQKFGESGTDEVWAAISFWNGTGTYVRAVPSYCSLKSTDFVKSGGSDPYGTGFSFKFTDNSEGGYPNQPTYIAYGISFRTYAPGTTGSSNGTALTIGANTDGYRVYNISFTKK